MTHPVGSAANTRLTFITGNANKLAEVNQILATSDSSPALYHFPLDLPELQGEPIQVAKAKARHAFSQLKRPVLVEDTSLCFNALNGLPGVYIKWFLASLGHEGLNRMLAGFDDKTAYAQCIFALAVNDTDEPLIFVGRCAGRIVMPRVAETKSAFGWDPVFECSESSAECAAGQTFGEMSSSHKNLVSHRYRALQLLKQHLAQHPHLLGQE